MAYLQSLHKRVNALADEKAIPDQSDKLWIMWSNLKAMLNENDSDYYTEVMYFTAVMAKKIDLFATSNMLVGNPTVARILFELDQMKPCVYELLECDHKTLNIKLER